MEGSFKFFMPHMSHIGEGVLKKFFLINCFYNLAPSLSNVAEMNFI